MFIHSRFDKSLLLIKVRRWNDKTQEFHGSELKYYSIRLFVEQKKTSTYEEVFFEADF
jgi:hypothetical protein